MTYSVIELTFFRNIDSNFMSLKNRLLFSCYASLNEQLIRSEDVRDDIDEDVSSTSTLPFTARSANVSGRWKISRTTMPICHNEVHATVRFPNMLVIGCFCLLYLGAVT